MKETLFPVMKIPPQEAYRNLRDVRGLPPGYEKIREMILSPFEDGNDIESNYGTVVLVLGPAGGGKTLLSRQILVEFVNNLEIASVLSKVGEKLTAKLTRFDDCTYYSKKIMGVGWDRQTPHKVYALASLSLERTVYWAQEHLRRPWLMVIDVPVFPYPDRDLGGSAVEQIARLKNINLFTYAVLPNRELQGDILKERKVLEDSSLTQEGVKLGVMARHREIRLRRSMASVETMRRIDEEIFGRIDMLISQGVLPWFLDGFRDDPKKKHLALEYHIRHQCQQFFGIHGNFVVVENLKLPEVQEHNDTFGYSQHEDIFGIPALPSKRTRYSLPQRKIVKETFEMFKTELLDPNRSDTSFTRESADRLLLNHVPKAADGVE